MKKFVLLSLLALLAFGGGYSDLLVRPSWAHDDTFHHSHVNGEIVPEQPNPIEVAVHAAISLYEWLDGCYGDAQDYFEERRQEQLSQGGGGGTVSSSNDAVYQAVSAQASPPAGTETNTNTGVTTKPNCFEGQANPDPECN